METGIGQAVAAAAEPVAPQPVDRRADRRRQRQQLGGAAAAAVPGLADGGGDSRRGSISSDDGYASRAPKRMHGGQLAAALNPHPLLGYSRGDDDWGAAAGDAEREDKEEEEQEAGEALGAGPGADGGDEGHPVYDAARDEKLSQLQAQLNAWSRGGPSRTPKEQAAFNAKFFATVHSGGSGHGSSSAAARRHRRTMQQGDRQRRVIPTRPGELLQGGGGGGGAAAATAAAAAGLAAAPGVPSGDGGPVFALGLAAPTASFWQRLRAIAGVGTVPHVDADKQIGELLAAGEGIWEEGDSSLPWQKVAEPVVAGVGAAKASGGSLELTAKLLYLGEGDNTRSAASVSLLDTYLQEGGEAGVQPGHGEQQGEIVVQRRRKELIRFQLCKPLLWVQARVVVAGPHNEASHTVATAYAVGKRMKIAADAACASLLSFLTGDNPIGLACKAGHTEGDIGILSTAAMPGAPPVELVAEQPPQQQQQQQQQHNLGHGSDGDEDLAAEPLPFHFLADGGGPPAGQQQQEEHDGQGPLMGLSGGHAGGVGGNQAAGDEQMAAPMPFENLAGGGGPPAGAEQQQAGPAAGGDGGNAAGGGDGGGDEPAGGSLNLADLVLGEVRPAQPLPCRTFQEAEYRLFLHRKQDTAFGEVKETSALVGLDELRRFQQYLQLTMAWEAPYRIIATDAACGHFRSKNMVPAGGVEVLTMGDAGYVLAKPAAYRTKKDQRVLVLKMGTVVQICCITLFSKGGEFGEGWGLTSIDATAAAAYDLARKMPHLRNLPAVKDYCKPADVPGPATQLQGPLNRAALD